MSALDASIVNVVLPVIRRQFGSSVSEVQWVVTVYLLAVSATLLAFGRLGDISGHKRSYLAGFGVFGAASALCALAGSVTALTAYRALQALGAAVLFANSPAILTANFAPQMRGRVLGLQATMTYLGLTAGPPFGGWLAENLTWRSVFLINVPIAVVALVLGHRVIPADSGRHSREPFDWAGSVLFGSSLLALLLALNQGHSWGWASYPIVLLLTAAALLLGTFLLAEKRSEHPMLDLALFGSRTFSATAASALLNYVAVYSVVFLMPFYLIQGRGLNAGTAGALLAIQSLVMAVTAPVTGALSDRTGSRTPAVAGMLVLAAGLLWLSTLGARTPNTTVAMALALVGLGTGGFISPNNSALMGSAPMNCQGVASAILAEARNVGMVLGVGLAGALFTTRLAGLEPGPRPEFFEGISAAFVAAAAVALLGALTSSLQESRVSAT